MQTTLRLWLPSGSASALSRVPSRSACQGLVEHQVGQPLLPQVLTQPGTSSQFYGRAVLPSWSQKVTLMFVLKLQNGTDSHTLHDTLRHIKSKFSAVSLNFNDWPINDPDILQTSNMTETPKSEKRSIIAISSALNGVNMKRVMIEAFHLCIVVCITSKYSFSIPLLWYLASL